MGYATRGGPREDEQSSTAACSASGACDEWTADTFRESREYDREPAMSRRFIAEDEAGIAQESGHDVDKVDSLILARVPLWRLFTRE